MNRDPYKVTVQIEPMEVGFAKCKDDIMSVLSKEDRKNLINIFSKVPKEELWNVVKNLKYIPVRVDKYNIDPAYIIYKVLNELII
jgi:hypothetical protein